MNCPQCGHTVDSRALFCPNCGTKMAAATTDQRGKSRRSRKTATSRTQAEGRGCGMSLLVITLAALVVVIIVGVGYLGVRMGLRDRVAKEREIAVEHYQKGLQYLDEGQIELAIAEFELTTQIDPNHGEAVAKLSEARAKLEVQPTATPMLQVETKAAYYQELVDAHAAGDWTQVLDAADRLLALDSEYKRAEVDGMLFDAFASSGQELVQQDRVKEAIRLFDRALALQPDNVQVAHEKNLATLYSTAMGYWNADWAQAIDNLTQLYALSPDYRDVRQRMFDAHVNYGDQLALGQDWCEAERQYAKALTLKADNTLADKQKTALTQCQQPAVNPAKPTAGVEDSSTPQAPAGTYVGSVTRMESVGGNKIFVRGKVLGRGGAGVAGTRVQIKAWDWSTVAVTNGEGQYSFDGLSNPVTYTLSLLDLPGEPVDAAGVEGKLTWVDFVERQ